LAGINADLRSNRTIGLNSGSFLSAGSSIQAYYGRGLGGGVGAFALVGNDVIIISKLPPYLYSVTNLDSYVAPIDLGQLVAPSTRELGIESNCLAFDSMVQGSASGDAYLIDNVIAPITIGQTLVSSNISEGLTNNCQAADSLASIGAP
jgi:hypothetical protein